MKIPGERRRYITHLSVEAVCLSVLCRCSGQVKQDVTSGVLKVELAFPRGAEESGPVGLVQDGDNPAAAAHELVAGDPLDPEALQWW